ncbi:MAG: DUF2225 domain-containing protein [Thermotogae bacterium]|nr:DUF2225 domain-containing protein [Thermotogota bacterium]
MREFWKKQFECPMCGTNFDSIKVFSEAVRVASRDTDLKPNYEGVNPLFFSLIVCPNCYYTAFERDFQELPKRLDPEKLVKLKKVLKVAKEKYNIDLSENRTLDDVIKIYSLAIVVYTLAGDDLKLSELYLRLSWFFREKKDEDREFVAVARTIKHLEHAYENVKNIKDEDRIIYLLGELNLKLGRREDARRWFSKLIEDKKYSDSSYAKFARDRMFNLR